MRNTPPSELATAKLVEFRDVPPAKRPFFKAFRDLQDEIADLLPNDSQPDGCLTYYFDACNPWNGAMHIARLKIREDGTSVKEAKAITAAAIKRIRAGIADYQASLPIEMAKLKIEVDRRRLLREERALARMEREANDVECRRLANEQYPDLIEGVDEDYIIVAGAMLVEGEPMTPEEQAESDRYWAARKASKHATFAEFKAAFEASELKRKDEETHTMNGHANNIVALKPNGKTHEFETSEWDRIETTHHIPPHDFWAESNIEQIRPPMVPELIWNVASEYARRSGVDRDALITTMITVASMMIPTNIKASAYNQDDMRFIEALRIWQANVGDSGGGKTPTLNPCRTVLDEIEAQYLEDHRAAKAHFKAQPKEEQKNIDPPVRRYMVLPDASTESAQVAFAGNDKDGIALLYEELTAFFGATSRYANKSGGGEQSSQSFWLNVYDSKHFSSSRMSRDEIDCDPSGSLIGGIQTKIIHQLLASASSTNGLVQRFQPVMMPRRMRPPQPMDKPLYPFTLFDNLLRGMFKRMPLRATGATLRFSEKAEIVRDEMFAWVASKTEEYEHRNPQLAMHLSKYKGVFLRYCGVFHMIEHYGDTHPRPISAETASMVYKFMTSSRYSQAKAFYTKMRANAEDDDMRNIAEFILSKRLAKVDTRTIQNGSSRFDRLSAREIANTADAMIALGWLTRIVGKRVDSFNWQVNPEVHKLFKHQTGIVRERNAKAVANIEAAKAAAAERDRLEDEDGG